MKDAQVRAALSTMDPKAREAFLTQIQSLPEGMRAAAKDMLATGTITSEEAVKLNAVMPKFSGELMTMGRTLKAGGKVSADQLAATRDRAIDEAKMSAVRNKTLAEFPGELQSTMVGVFDLSEKEKGDYKKALQEQADSVKKTNTAETMAELQKRVAKASNTFTDFLASSGLLKSFGDVFETLTAFVQSVAVPVFNALTGVMQFFIPIISDVVVPALQMLGDWISFGVMPILEKLGSTVGTILTPIFSAIGFVLENAVEPALFFISDVVDTLVVPALQAIAYIAAGLVAVKLGFMAASAATAAMGFIALAKPFLPLIGIVLAAYVAFKGIKFIVENFGDIMSTVGDGVKLFFGVWKQLFAYIKLGFYKVLDSLPFVNMKKQIQETEGEIASLQEERKKTAEQIDERWKKKSNSQDDKRATAKEMREQALAERRAAREAGTFDRREARDKNLNDDKRRLLEEEKKSKEIDTSSPESMAEGLSRALGGFFHKQVDTAKATQKIEKETADAKRSLEEGSRRLSEAKDQKERDLAVKQIDAANKQLGSLKQQEDKLAKDTKSLPGKPGGEKGEAFKGNQKEFYNKMYETLLASAKKQGVENPEAIAHLGASQSAVETGYGKHLAGGNNYFGIKARPGEGGAGQKTQEFINGKMVTVNDKFRKYGSMEESADDYVKFLKENKRYKGVLQAKSADEAIEAQGRTGYATDPNYAAKLKTVYKRGDTTIRQGAAVAEPTKKSEAAKPVEDKKGPSWWSKNAPSWMGGDKKVEPAPPPKEEKKPESDNLRLRQELAARTRAADGLAMAAGSGQNADGSANEAMKAFMANEARMKELFGLLEKKSEPAKPASDKKSETYTINGKPASKEQFDKYMKDNPELAKMMDGKLLSKPAVLPKEETESSRLKQELEARQKAAGGYAMAAGSGQNADGTANAGMKAFMANESRMQEIFGLLDKSSTLVNDTQIKTSSMFDNILGGFNKMIPDIGGMFGSLIPNISSSFTTAFSGVTSGISSFFSKGPIASLDSKIAKIDTKSLEKSDTVSAMEKLLGKGPSLLGIGTASPNINNGMSSIDSMKGTLADTTSTAISDMGSKFDQLFSNMQEQKTTEVAAANEKSNPIIDTLNSKLDRLIDINLRLASINDDQLRVQRGIGSGDMFSSVG
jgi:flagellum-specific peptidoglycan hydrolase FlgJ